MSTRQDTLTYCKAQLDAAITAGTLTANQVHLYFPEPFPMQEGPQIVLDMGQVQYTPLNFRALGAGTIQEEYDINIGVYLGSPDMTRALADAADDVYADQLRAIFANDPTLGAHCWNSDLTRGIDNLDVFRQTSDMPTVTYTLHVQEHKTYGAAAS